MSDPKTAAIIVAGGMGERLGRAGGKQLAPVLGRPVLSWALAAFDACLRVDLVIVVCHPDRIDEYEDVAVRPLGMTTPVLIAAGGVTRQASVASGLSLVPGSVRTVLVHDGARPLVTSGLIAGALDALSSNEAAVGLVVGYPAVDTLKEVDGALITVTPDRSRFWAVQTPQIFDADVLRSAYTAAEKDGFLGTDDSSLVERMGHRVVVFEGPRDNIKVTVSEDLLFVEAALRHREEGVDGG